MSQYIILVCAAVEEGRADGCENGGGEEVMRREDGRGGKSMDVPDSS